MKIFGLKQHKEIFLMIVILILMIALVYYLSSRMQDRLDHEMPNLGLLTIIYN